MSHPIVTHGFIPPEKRITRDLVGRLEELAPLFLIKVEHLNKQRTELSGIGFQDGEPLVLPTHIAKVRLLAEICSILARWVSFNLWEPCEVTLFAVPTARIERCAFNWRRKLTQQAKEAKATAAGVPTVVSTGAVP